MSLNSYKGNNEFNELYFLKKSYKKIYFLHDEQSNSGDNVLMRELALIVDGFLVDFKSLIKIKNEKNNLIFFANIDNYLQTNYIIDKMSANFDLAIYALKHPFQGIVDFYISSNKCLWYLSIKFKICHKFISLLISYIIKLKINFSLVRNLKDILFLIPFNNIYYQKLKMVKFLIASCEEEKQILKQKFSGSEVLVIPHLTNIKYSNSKQSNLEPKKFVLIAGRSEKRKNIRATLMLIDKYRNIKFMVIVKTIYSNKFYSSYTKDLLNELKKRSNVILKTNLSIEELTTQIMRCSILINTSWFEVSSMIDLWALNFGKSIITTKNSYLKESNLVKLHDPFYKESVLKQFSLYLQENDYEL